MKKRKKTKWERTKTRRRNRTPGKFTPKSGAEPIQLEMIL